jgi:hypothetical protein
MTNDETNPNDEIRNNKGAPGKFLSFELRYSDIRHWSFVIFPLAIWPEGRTLGGHEACAALWCNPISIKLLRLDRRGAAASAGRSNGQSFSK